MFGGNPNERAPRPQQQYGFSVGHLGSEQIDGQLAPQPNTAGGPTNSLPTGSGTGGFSSSDNAWAQAFQPQTADPRQGQMQAHMRPDGLRKQFDTPGSLLAQRNAAANQPLTLEQMLMGIDPSQYGWTGQLNPGALGAFQTNATTGQMTNADGSAVSQQQYSLAYLQQYGPQAWLAAIQSGQLPNPRPTQVLMGPGLQAPSWMDAMLQGGQGQPMTQAPTPVAPTVGQVKPYGFGATL